MSDDPTKGTRIRARRKELGLSQTKLAKAVGVSQATIQKIEIGEITSSKFTPTIWATLDLPLGELNPIFKQPNGPEHATDDNLVLEYLRHISAKIDALDERLAHIERQQKAITK